MTGNGEHAPQPPQSPAAPAGGSGGLELPSGWWRRSGSDPYLECRGRDRVPAVFVDEHVEVAGGDLWTPDEVELYARRLLEAAVLCRAWREGAR